MTQLRFEGGIEYVARRLSSFDPPREGELIHFFGPMSGVNQAKLASQHVVHCEEFGQQRLNLNSGHAHKCSPS